ncbi:MFS transporter [Desulfosoma caldarium]|uniref:Putative MFS family arabinose efflux permease n=1 Tax=Desulfosoma caldarium TaxID=610254 RepID=A0A3N1UTA8_9BACT|nr:MFS transporter [Desulfosoma caldarium]ROQ93383.1 putative MFS family arabinose efflux permease [Desulfosoma caldarium]
MFLGMSPSRWWILIFSRLWLNAGVRLAYPFLPTIARGLGIGMEQAGFLVAARSFVGLSAIAFGFLSEKKGEKVGLLVGLVFFSLGGLSIGLYRTYPWVLVGFILMGLAHAVYNPAVQSYVSAHVPYAGRARALGLLESSWSMGWFVGMPVGGFLIARFGWHVPYGALGLIGMVLCLATTRLPAAPEPHRAHPSTPPTSRDNPRSTPCKTAIPNHRTMEKITAHRPVAFTFRRRLWPALAVTFFALFANESLMIVYGAWMEFRFAVGIDSLGLLSTSIGVMELAAELSVALVVDRLGKKRALAAGLLGAAACYAALLMAQESLPLAMVVFGAIAYCFEFTVVSSFPYMSELDPGARRRWLSANYTLMVAGRVAGALAGPWLWEHTHTLYGHIGLSFVATLMAFGFLRLAPNPDHKPAATSGRC